MRMDNEVINYNKLKTLWKAGDRHVQLAIDLLDGYLKIVDIDDKNGFVKDCGFVVKEYSFLMHLMQECVDILYDSFLPNKGSMMERNDEKEKAFFNCEMQSVNFGEFVKVEIENKENKDDKDEEKEYKLQLKYKCVKNKLSHLTMSFNTDSRYIKLKISDDNNEKILCQYIDMYVCYNERFISNENYNVTMFENYDNIINDCGVIKLQFENDEVMDEFFNIIYYFNRGQGIKGYDNIIKIDETKPKLWHVPPYCKFFKKFFGRIFEFERILLPANFHGGGKSVLNHLLLIISGFVCKNFEREGERAAHERMLSWLFDSNDVLVKYATISDKRYFVAQKKMIDKEYLIMKSNTNGRYLLEKDLRWVVQIGEVREQAHFFVARALTRFASKQQENGNGNGNENEVAPNSFDSIWTRKKNKMSNKTRLRGVIMQCTFNQLFELLSNCDKWNYYVSGAHLIKLMKQVIDSNVDKRILNRLKDECDEKVLIESGEKLDELMKHESICKMITDKDRRILSVMSKALARKNHLLKNSAWLKFMFLFSFEYLKTIKLLVCDSQVLTNMAWSENIYHGLIVNAILNGCKNGDTCEQFDESWKRLNRTNEAQMARLSSKDSKDCNDSNASKVENNDWDF